MFLSSSLVFSQSSKHLAFLSLHLLHIKHNRTILHTFRTERLPTWPRQQSNTCTTLASITQWTLIRVKIALYNSLATLQWSKRWSIHFLLLLHMQYHSTTMTLLFLGLSNVKIFPWVVVHTKKLSQGTLTFQTLLQGNEKPPEVDNSWKNDLTSNFFLFGGKLHLSLPNGHPICNHPTKL